MADCAPTAKCVRKVALRTLARLHFATALECCEADGMARETLQLRLRKQRLMVAVGATGIRSRNPSGCSAEVFKLTSAG